MNGDDPLHAFFDDLRQPATASEMTRESVSVDVVATALMSSKGTPMRFLSNSRRLRVASFVAAGIVGFGGVAAAGPAVYDTVAGSDWPKTEQPVEETDDNVVETTVVPEATVPETTTVAETVAPTSVVASPDGVVDGVTTTVVLVDDPETDFNETKCADGNHGQTVSSIAKETPSGPGKGQIVSEAAHSSCGKGGEVDDETDEPEDEADEADTAGSPENGKGNGNGNGKGSNGGGNGNSGAGNGNSGAGNGNSGAGKHKDD